MEFGRQEASAPETVVEWLVVRTTAAEGGHHHVGGEIGVFAAETVGGPGADAWAAGQLTTRLHEGDGRVMVDGLRVHRPDDAPFVSLGRHVGHQFAEPVTGLTVLLELKDRRSHREVLLARGHRRQALALADGVREVLAAHRFQLRLRIEEVHLRRSAGLEEVDDPFRLRFEVGETEPRVSGKSGRAYERAQRGEADTSRGALDEGATGQGHLRGLV